MATRIPLRDRVVIADVRPRIDDGTADVKRVVGDVVEVSADVLRDGHALLDAEIRYRRPGDRRTQAVPLLRGDDDRWDGAFAVDQIGRWTFWVAAWTDHWATWLSAARARHAAGVLTDLDCQTGASLLARRTGPRGTARGVLDGTIDLLTSDAPFSERMVAAGADEVDEILMAHPERLDTTEGPKLPIWVDRPAARFAAWYEMFPRSEGAEGTTSGTFRTAARRLPAIADMGFDVVYLPPIHPIGTTNRKGANNSLEVHAGDPGVPWAIGSAEGGHDAVHPDLGTIHDLDDFVARAHEVGLEVALDLALQVSPDHPWVTDHPEWFTHRPDGSIAYAENPPKRYQDIYPIDFDTPDYEGLRAEVLRIVHHWVAHGIRTFRVDNPHTKPVVFWRWLIEEVHRQHPDVLFLSEAFTRPKMMAALAKAGFSQSYTYFAWRSTKAELTEYAAQLSRPPWVDFFRPSFWPNTPDILTEELQTGGPPAFKTRLALAALLSPLYGIYSGYELCESTPVRPGSEEYLDSEKYQLRPRDWDAEGSLAPWITTINEIRRSHPALERLDNLVLHHIDNDRMLAFSKATDDRSDVVLVIVNLDPHAVQEATTWLDTAALGLAPGAAFTVEDLLTGARHDWRGADNYVRLDPELEPIHVLVVRRP